MRCAPPPTRTAAELLSDRATDPARTAEAPTLSEEFVLAEQPDVIVGAWGESYDPDTLLAHHPTWDVVPALRNDRVYSLPAGLLLRPGPRLVTGAVRMATRLYPGLVPDSSSFCSSDATRSPPAP